MTHLKLAVCSVLLMTSVMATADDICTQTVPVPDKRVVTIRPVRPQGYMLYNFGLNLLLRKDLSQLPPTIPLPDGLVKFLNSYDVANVILPARPYNGLVKFDVVRTDSGQGLGHYVFCQSFANNVATLRVLQSPVPSIPFTTEISHGVSFLSELTDNDPVLEPGEGSFEPDESEDDDEVIIQ